METQAKYRSGWEIFLYLYMLSPFSEAFLLCQLLSCPGGAYLVCGRCLIMMFGSSRSPISWLYIQAFNELRLITKVSKCLTDQDLRIQADRCQLRDPRKYGTQSGVRLVRSNCVPMRHVGVGSEDRNPMQNCGRDSLIDFAGGADG